MLTHKFQVFRWLASDEPEMAQTELTELERDPWWLAHMPFRSKEHDELPTPGLRVRCLLSLPPAATGAL
jgi:hypothetical protein